MEKEPTKQKWAAPIGYDVPDDTPILPVFVYGTLRPGYGNWEGSLKHAHQHVMPAELCGMRLVARIDAFFPYLVTCDADEVVTGDLVFIKPALYHRVLGQLDRLEGTPTHYERVQCTVECKLGTVTAWAYKAGDWIQRELNADRTTAAAVLRALYPVTGNDWSMFARQRVEMWHETVVPALLRVGAELMPCRRCSNPVLEIYGTKYCLDRDCDLYLSDQSPKKGTPNAC
jgi:gamma-glutamylcyclotransferase (GGCT)/AIG2-like uncharacterized protein YtfP